MASRPLSAKALLDSEEAKLLERAEKSGVPADVIAELGIVALPAVREAVEKALAGAAGGSGADLRALGAPKTLKNLKDNLAAVDWSVLGLMTDAAKARAHKHLSFAPRAYRKMIAGKIRLLYPLDSWMAMDSEEKQGVRIVLDDDESSLKRVATALGVPGNPAKSPAAFRNFMAAAFGERAVAAYESARRSSLAAALRALHPLEEWMAMSNPKRLAVKIIFGAEEWGLFGAEEWGLMRVAGTLGIRGNPCNDVKVFRALVAAVFGEEAVRNCPVQPRKPSGK